MCFFYQQKNIHILCHCARNYIHTIFFNNISHATTTMILFRCQKLDYYDKSSDFYYSMSFFSTRFRIILPISVIIYKTVPFFLCHALYSKRYTIHTSYIYTIIQTPSYILEAIVPLTTKNTYFFQLYGLKEKGKIFFFFFVFLNKLQKKIVMFHFSNYKVQKLF